MAGEEKSGFVRFADGREAAHPSPLAERSQTRRGCFLQGGRGPHRWQMQCVIDRPPHPLEDPHPLDGHQPLHSGPAEHIGFHAYGGMCAHSLHPTRREAMHAREHNVRTRTAVACPSVAEQLHADPAHLRLPRHPVFFPDRGIEGPNIAYCRMPKGLAAHMDLRCKLEKMEMMIIVPKKSDCRCPCQPPPCLPPPGHGRKALCVHLRPRLWQGLC